ncbi:MAG: hypothetical protein EZS28_004201 [Streblomastix strix]|uniref:Leucine Rich Repeat family protein n=1 Tax=Streblomastix strix TaxID=222440 RepID=A0A5J4X0Y5_9EUKA|nr:MAG: hypothetical protein EZS28_004201 [Streblomastix strix]
MTVTDICYFLRCKDSGVSMYTPFVDALKLHRTQIELATLSSDQHPPLIASAIFSLSLYPHLTRLCLSGSQKGLFSDRYVQNSIRQIIANSHSLTELDLSFCNLTDQEGVSIAQAFEYNQSIHIINLSGNMIGENTVIQLSESITKRPIIYSLDLSMNKTLSTLSAWVNALSIALPFNTGIKALRLSGSSSAMNKLFTCLKQIGGVMNFGWVGSSIETPHLLQFLHLFEEIDKDKSQFLKQAMNSSSKK